MNHRALFCFTLQSLTGKYRGLQGNPCNKNRDPAMRTGVPCKFPVMKTGFSLCELTYREFPLSLTGFGIAVYLAKRGPDYKMSQKSFGF